MSILSSFLTFSRVFFKLKDFLKHDSLCGIKVAGGCKLCARISNLLTIHARTCRIDNCRVPHCVTYRERIRKLTLRQQAMDDRRRQMVNSESSGRPAPVFAEEEEDEE